LSQLHFLFAEVNAIRIIKKIMKNQPVLTAHMPMLYKMNDFAVYETHSEFDKINSKTNSHISTTEFFHQTLIII